MAGVCTNEWCEAVEHVLDDLNNALFSISEPRWSDKDCSKRIKTVKRRIYDIYVNYKGVYANVASFESFSHDLEPAFVHFGPTKEGKCAIEVQAAFPVLFF